MTATTPNAFLKSAALHALPLLLVVLAYLFGLRQEPPRRIFELVAGEGDNFAATAAPALGEPGGIKLDLPEPPPVRPEPPQPVAAPPPDPSPVSPAPLPKPPEKTAPKAPDPNLNFSQKLKKAVIRADANAKRAVAKERAAEAKRLSKEEFDRNQKAKTATQTTKIAKAAGEGIKKGVPGGSTENKTGGAGGKALTREDGPVMDAYFALLKDRLRTALEKPPGLSDSLVTMVQVHISAEGTLSGARITKSSGSAEFDSAVIAAISATRMPARPDGKSETLNIPFRMKEPEEN